MSVSLLTGHRPQHTLDEERVPLLVAPEARERLNDLLCSPAFKATGVGYSAFILRACEAAETEYAERQSVMRSLPRAAEDFEHLREQMTPERAVQHVTQKHGVTRAALANFLREQGEPNMASEVRYLGQPPLRIHGRRCYRQAT